jgi:transcription termination/antitermination protein NusG
MKTALLDRTENMSANAGSQAALQWFALRVRSNFEQPVSNLLSAKGVEGFLPTYRSRRIWSDRVRELRLPLFPGYVFCRIPAEERSLVLATTGVVSMIGVQGRPLPIDDAEIAAVRRMVDGKSPVEPWPFLRIGQRVQVRRGPLAGVEGILLRVKDACRLVVSVTLLGRSVATEIDAAYVKPA